MSPTPPTEKPSRRPGTGGRWRIYLGRTVLWAALVILAINGIVNQVQTWTGLGSSDPDQGEQTNTTQEAHTDFPDQAAGAFAADFAEVYLSGPDQETASEQDQDEDGQESPALADFVPEDEVNTYTLPEDVTGERVRVVQVQAHDEHRGVVTLSTRINGAPMHLEVPVYADGAAALVVAATPALLPAPEQASLPEAEESASDTEAAEAMEPVVEGFLAAWAETPEHLDRYAHPDADMAPLPAQTLEFSSVDLLVPAEGGSEVLVQAEVTWQPTDANETITQSYELEMVETGGAWYVRDIQGAVPAPSS